MYKQIKTSIAISNLLIQQALSLICSGLYRRRLTDQLQSLLKLLCLGVVSLFSINANAANDTTHEPYNWGVGGYFGQYYSTSPVSIFSDKTELLDQYLAAITGYYVLWRAETLPLALEFDAMTGVQFGKATLAEVAAAPTIRWSGFPWNDYLHTALRIGPLGVSYTSSVGPYEKTSKGGANVINLTFVEFVFSLPDKQEHEMFFRLHHRCALFNTLNDYGVNGEDFMTLGYRHSF